MEIFHQLTRGNVFEVSEASVWPSLCGYYGSDR
jgi:hypothetical protein